MSVRIKRGDPLRDCGDKEQIQKRIDALKKGGLSLLEFKDAQGWLRGAIKVMSKQTRACAYIRRILNDTVYDDANGI